MSVPARSASSSSKAAKTANPTPVAPSSEPSAGAKLLASLSGKIEPVPVSFAYRLALLTVAVVMCLMPVLYLLLTFAMVAVVGVITMGIGRAIWGDRNVGIGLGLLHLVGLAIEIMLLIFMIRPLFVRRGWKFHPLTFTRQEQPLLYAYVEHLCDMVGAPRPTRIDVDTDVNAAAGMDGMLGVLFGRRLVLVLGLPLVAALDLRQFSGVLAHELGHLAQGTAMRLSFIIRRVSNWLAAMVYGRDSWDDALERSWNRNSNNWFARIFIAIPIGLIWVTRKAQWLIYIAGATVSALMLRQMEFDADRYEFSVAGTDCSLGTTKRLESLMMATQMAMGDLNQLMLEQRLCDDLPALIVSREKDLPAEVKERISNLIAKQGTGWFDTHPSSAERLARAREYGGADSKGVITVDGPATLLFKDFKDLSRRATVALYHARLGPGIRPQNLVATEAFNEERRERIEGYDALGRFFQGLLHPARPVFLANPSTRAPKDLNAAAEALLNARSKFVELSPGARKAAQAYAEADRDLDEVVQVKALRTAGEKGDPKRFRFASVTEAELIKLEQAARKRLGTARKQLDEALHMCMRRMELALWIYERSGLSAPARKGKPPPLPASAKRSAHGEYDLASAPEAGSRDVLKDALRILEQATPKIESIRAQLPELAALMSSLKKGVNPQPFIRATIKSGQAVGDAMDELRLQLDVTPYPYEYPKPKASVGYVTVPSPRQMGEVLPACSQTLDLIYGLYVRILGDFVKQAEEAEKSIGLDALPEVKSV